MLRGFASLVEGAGAAAGPRDPPHLQGVLRDVWKRKCRLVEGFSGMHGWPLSGPKPVLRGVAIGTLLQKVSAQGTLRDPQRRRRAIAWYLRSPALALLVDRKTVPEAGMTREVLFKAHVCLSLPFPRCVPAGKGTWPSTDQEG